MTDETGNDGESKSPIEVFSEANENFQSRLIEAGDDPAAQVEAVDSFLSRVAGTDPRESLRRQIIDIVAENVDFMTKSAAERQLNEEVRSSGGPDDRPDIRDCLGDGRLNRIEKLASSESESEARYRFVFEGGDSMVIDSETLYSPTNFRRAYNGVYDTLPTFSGEIEEWENFLAHLQNDYLVVKTDSVGPRAAALTKLRSKVESSEAYIDRADSIRKGNGVLIDADSVAAAESAETVWVLYDEIKRICDDLDITPEAFRIELDNRDLRNGSSEQKRFDGKRATFWPLVRSEFEPKLVEPPEESEDESDGYPRT